MVVFILYLFCHQGYCCQDRTARQVLNSSGGAHGRDTCIPMTGAHPHEPQHNICNARSLRPQHRGKTLPNPFPSTYFNIFSIPRRQVASFHEDPAAGPSENQLSCMSRQRPPGISNRHLIMQRSAFKRRGTIHQARSTPHNLNLISARETASS